MLIRYVNSIHMASYLSGLDNNVNSLFGEGNNAPTPANKVNDLVDENKLSQYVMSLN